MTHTYSNGLPSGSAFFEFTASGSLEKTYQTSDIAVRIVGTPHAVWFTDYAHDTVDELDAAGRITRHKAPTANGGPFAITVAPNGAIWFTEYTASKVARIGSNGIIDEVSVPIKPFSIAATPPGPPFAVWVGSDYAPSPLVQITTGS